MADADGHAGAGERALMMRQAQVWFPVTVAGSRCKLNRVEVTAYPQSHRGRKSCPSGKSGEVKQLLGYARHGEGIEAVEMDVVVHMDDLDFAEGSFGLALAIADKLARFGANANAQEIVATGIVGNQGGVSGIGAFADKLALVLDGQPAGTLFVFPRANAAEAEQGLAALTANGIAWRAVDAVSELADLWQETAASTSPAPLQGRRSSRLAAFSKGLVLGFLLVLGLAAGVAVMLR